MQYRVGQGIGIIRGDLAALLNPGAPEGLIDDLWAIAEDEGSLDRVLGAFLAYGFDAVGDFALLHRENGRQTLILRGNVRAEDGSDERSAVGDHPWHQVASTNGEIVRLTLGNQLPGGILPLLAGVVHASAITVHSQGARRLAPLPELPLEVEPRLSVASGMSPLLRGAGHAPALSAAGPASIGAPGTHSSAPGSATAADDDTHAVFPAIVDDDTHAVVTPGLVPTPLDDSTRASTPAPIDDKTHTAVRTRADDRTHTALAASADDPEDPAPSYHLRLITGDEIPLDRPVLVGRAPHHSATGPEAGPPPRLVVVPSQQGDISRTHARFETSDGSVLVTDLNSTNGLYVRSDFRPPRRPTPGVATHVDAGSVIDLGDGITLTVEVST